MHKIHIISVGKLTKNFVEIAAEYRKMIKYNLNATEISYTKKMPATQIKAFEAYLIKKYLSDKSYRIALNVIGTSFTSHEFIKIFDINKDIDFIIGGAFGIDEELLKLCDMKLSISPMTLPHQLVKILLLEQIYRAQTILTNHPYHK